MIQLILPHLLKKRRIPFPQPNNNNFNTILKEKSSKAYPGTEARSRAKQEIWVGSFSQPLNRYILQASRRYPHRIELPQINIYMTYVHNDFIQLLKILIGFQYESGANMNLFEDIYKKNTMMSLIHSLEFICDGPKLQLVQFKTYNQKLSWGLLSFLLLAHCKICIMWSTSRSFTTVKQSASISEFYFENWFFCLLK